MSEATLVREPDDMGIWSEDGEIWLPRSRYPKRSAAIQFAMREWSVTFTEVSCWARWMRYEPFTAHNLDGSVAWTEDRWYECGRDEPGAFPVWRLS